MKGIIYKFDTKQYRKKVVTANYNLRKRGENFTMWHIGTQKLKAILLTLKLKSITNK